VSLARPLIARLLAVDPLTPLSRCMPAWPDVLDGRVAAAVEPYRQMLEVAVGRGFINHPFLARHDPALASLRRLPRFVQLMKIVRGRWVRFEA
jgi:hypothetical protein